MSDTNNKPAAEQQTTVTIKELLNFSDALCKLSISVDKAFFILGAMQDESENIGINKNQKDEICAKAVTFNNLVQWCNILNDYVHKSSQYTKALSSEYDRIYNSLKGVVQNG